jgi:hypothetical protein
MLSWLARAGAIHEWIDRNSDPRTILDFLCIKQTGTTVSARLRERLPQLDVHMFENKTRNKHWPDRILVALDLSSVLRDGRGPFSRWDRSRAE